jgi:hypothetical protein
MGENSVMVMDDNPAIKTNRLNLLGLVRNHARVLADFGSIVKYVDSGQTSTINSNSSKITTDNS